MEIASYAEYTSSSMHYARQEESQTTIRFQKTSNTPPDPQKIGVTGSKDNDEIVLDPKLRTIADILERLTGQKIKIMLFHAEGNAVPVPHVDPQSGEKRLGWSLEISSSYSLHEEQSLSFSSSGKIVTEEGKELNFSLNFQMSREFSLTQSTMFRAGDRLSDPLILSFDGGKPIAEGSFSFDLLQGGNKENIPLLSANSAFLTIDKNRDGTVNDGGELFGPKTGNGFEELIRYDNDRNGWIDDNDPVFKTLRLWFKSAEDEKSVTLQEAGIGALSLRPVNTSYDFKDASNTTRAQLQQTSLALTETGEAKPLYSINVAV